MPKVIDLPTATSMDNSDYLLMEESTGGTKKITRANAVNLDAIGGRYYKYISIPAHSSVSVVLDVAYGAFILVGSSGGYGGVVIACRINNDAITHSRNLITNVDWNNAGAVLSYSNYTLTVTNNTGDPSRFSIFAG